MHCTEEHKIRAPNLLINSHGWSEKIHYIYFILAYLNVKVKLF